MEILKTILRMSLSSGIEKISLKANLAPQFYLQGQLTPQSAAQVTEEEFATLIGFLLPKEANDINSGKNAKGILNIPGAGKIQIIYNASSKNLLLFMPNIGDALAVAEWQTLNQQASGQSTSSQMPAITMGKPTTTQVSPQAPTPPPVQAAPSPSTGGFIPPNFDNSPKLGNATGLNVLPPQFQTPPPQSTPIQENVGNSDLPSIKPSPSPATSAFAPPASFETNRFPESQDFAMNDDMRISIGGVDASTYAESTPEVLIYDAEKPGDSATSDGQNPIDGLLTQMVEAGASDLHLTNSQPIVFRIDGDIQRLEGQTLDSQIMEKFLNPILPAKNKKQLIETNDTDFAYQLNGVGRFRVNIFRDRNGIGSVMRHIPSEILTADQLGLQPCIRDLCKLSKGLVLVTGPTGSGKSTTLAAMIDLINKTRKEHVLTIEDPIEFVHPQNLCLMNQREVHKHTDSFKGALRAALREDPDIVLIGEMRDLETVAIAIETAETGHLVFGTLHTTTAMSTVDRLVDQFPTDQQEQIRIMLASSLKGVISQTLLKKIGGGRVAAHEILLINDAASAILREGKTHMLQSHMQTQRKVGNQTLNEALLNLVKNKEVTAQDAVQKSIDRAGFIEILKRNQISFEENKAA